MVFRAAVVSTLVSVASATNGDGSMVKSLYQNQERLFEQLEHHVHRRQMAETSTVSSFVRPSFLNYHHEDTNHRALEDSQGKCDSAFLNCLPNLKCVDCFATLELEEIDWTGVTPGMECADVVDILIAGNHCKKLKGDKAAIGTFCDTFGSCVVWESGDGADSADVVPPEEEDDWVNCTALTSCEWPGMKASWIGDGICNDNMHGCYNTEVCKWDGGDCCPDTCANGEGGFKECGHDGFACRNPDSDNCDPTLTAKCRNGDDDESGPSSVKCEEGEQKYRLVMYDSFGDGWDTTQLTITPQGKKTVVYQGSLDDGAQGTEYICLSKDATCYTADTSGGSWGVESSWELKPLSEGGPAIAGSGAPSNCVFPIAGSDCEKTCNGRPQSDPTDDPDYRSFKEMYNCINEKCIIQLGACKKDKVCSQCFEEDSPEYCYGVETFMAVIDCTMCSCTENVGAEVCIKKEAPGVVPAKDDPTKDDENAGPRKCSGQETMMGAKAVMDYSQCADMDQIGIMITDFDSNNFGQLDQFEACAHSYADEENHGGHTPLSCMKILYTAMTNPVAEGNTKNPPLEAISALAKDLYENAESFCDCTKKASDDCPLCPSFMSFKTLLYETLDACEALDQIDCAAWSEFAKPCQTNLEGEFGSINFKMQKQCDYAKKGCGGAGPFPAFRRIDCDGEVDSDAWSFYQKFSNNCLRGDDGIPPDDTPVKSPTKPPVAAPTKKPYPADDNKPTPKPYTPSDSNGSKPYIPSDQKNKKKSHWFRNFLILCVLGAGGYYVYKRRFDSFNFVQYRRVRGFGGFGNFGGGGGMRGGYDLAMSSDGDMYSNLNSSTAFEPPTLPPTPQQMMMGTEMT